jgi:hypothetical protein
MTVMPALDLTDAQKRSALRDHQHEVEALDPKSWFFIPGHDGQVLGYLGTGEIAVVGKRPSTAVHFAGQAAQSFEILVKYDLSNAHITDAIKTGGTISDPDPDEAAMRRHKELFLKEIRPLRLKAIIVMGHPGSRLRTFEIIQSFECGVPLYPIRHYSWMRWNRRNRTAWERELRAILTSIYPGRVYPKVEPDEPKQPASSATRQNGGEPPPKISYDAADLRFVCCMIEPLETEEHFLIRSRKFGPIQMSKAEFYAVFSNVVRPGSCYWTAGYYKYSTLPSRARRFLIS